MVEIARSVWELLRRAIQSWWTRVAGVLAVAAYLLEHLAPRAHVSNRVWLWIVAVGAATSVVEAYHQTRIERDTARADEVRDDHLQELQRRLGILLNNVEAGNACEYEDSPASAKNQLAFKAHYPDLEPLLDHWDQVVSRLARTHQEIRDALSAAVETDDDTAPWYGITVPEYDVGRVTDLIYNTVVSRATHGTLKESFVFSWSETTYPLGVEGQSDSEAMTKLELGGHVAVVEKSPAETYTDRLARAKARVEALWHEAKGWQSAHELMPAMSALADAQPGLQDELDHWKKATGVRVTRGCSICRKNEGWPEPKPPLRLRVADRIQRVFGRGRGEGA